MIADFYKANEARKDKFKREIMGDLVKIRNKLQELLQENDSVTEIEKLERDDFVIDIEKRDHFEEQGENVCKEIRNQASKTILTLELLKERVKERTWNKMEVPSESVKSIQSDKLIFNYSIRKREQQEQRRLTLIKQQRKIEIRQKVERLEKKHREALEECDFNGGMEEYIMNRIAAKPAFMTNDAILEAARIFEEERARKEKAKLDALNANNMN